MEEVISLFQLADTLTLDEYPNKHQLLRNLALFPGSSGRVGSKILVLGTRAVELVSNTHADKPELLNTVSSVDSCREELNVKEHSLI